MGELLVVALQYHAGVIEILYNEYTEFNKKKKVGAVCFKDWLGTEDVKCKQQNIDA